MSQPSYKNLLKRSRSSIDPVVDREEILQGIALACKARADGGDVLFSSRFLTGRLQDVTSVSQIAKVVTENSIANKLFFSSDNIRAVALARSPSYPFDSNKALIRWLLAGRRDGEDYKEQAGSSRRRKCTAGYGNDAGMQRNNIGKTGLPLSLSSSLNVAVSSPPPEDVNSTEPVHLQASTDCASSQISSAVSPLSDVVTGVVPMAMLASQVLEKVEESSSTIVNEAQLPPDTRVSSERDVVSPTAVETSPLVARRACCISRDRCPQFGLLSVCGRRREMEDTHTVEPDLVLLPCDALGGCHCNNRALCACSSFHFFAVYDGHGGTQASAFCKARLHKALTEELIKDVRSYKKAVNGTIGDWSSRWRRVMEACFLKIDEEVGGICPTGECSTVEGNPNCCVNPIAPDNVGTTAVVAVIGPCQIIVANCGDSRAVLSRGGNVVPLSTDHKPDREDEMSRIFAAGGRIIYWDGYRVGGLLAMSRAIGDRFLKKYVVAVPEVTCIERTKEDECLILASDGLWDVVSSEMACDIARRRLRSQRRKCAKSDNPSAEDTPAGAAAALLTKLALSRGSKDNISVIVIDLKSYCKKSL
eukprot:c29518_g1_i1 orf=388-2157(+)